MAGILDTIAARIAALHARRTFSRFWEALHDVPTAQERALRRALRLVAGGAYAAQHGLDRVRSSADFRRAAPLVTYDDLRSSIERVRAGDETGLFRRGQRIAMFATSSGTTSAPKYVPVTPDFVADYRRGWNTFGLKMLSDHPRAFLRSILQSSGRHDESRTDTGIPCGAITGLLARTQKRIVRRYYVGRPEIALLNAPETRYYALMRLGAGRDVAFAVTANPATLIRLAEVANEHSEALIRDVHDGTLSDAQVPDARLRGMLLRGVRPDPAAAKRLAQVRAAADGLLRPRDIWTLDFVACWTGGSMGNYLRRLREWWGELPVRDVGLLASEGRVTLPLEDNSPAGVLDVTAGFFEFLPLDAWERGGAETLLATELEVGRDYVVVLTNTTGLVRYRLDDVVRCRGWTGAAPMLEFLHRAGGVSSMAGEKLTENQVVEGFRTACRSLGMAECDFVIGPQFEHPPFYVCCCGARAGVDFAARLDQALGECNDEYASRRKSGRLGPVRLHRVPASLLQAFEARLLAERGSRAEQFKRPHLLTREAELRPLLGSEVGSGVA
jgi:hypothetical protein